MRSLILALVAFIALTGSGKADGFPTGGGSNATKIQGVAVPTVGAAGTVLTAGSGPSLTWTMPAAGVMLSNTTPAAVGTAAVGAGTTAARSDHVHALPTTAVAAGTYPASGQIPTFTVDANGRLTTAGSTATLTAPAISGPVITGTESGTRTIGGTPTLGVNLAAGGFKVTGLGSPSSTGDALAYPWLGSINGSASLATSSFVLNAATGVYQDIGLIAALPGAGTYLITAQVRAEIIVSSGAGAFVECKLFNATDGTDVPNSERLAVQANSLNVLQQGTVTIQEVVSVAAAKSIRVYCMRTFSGTVTTSDIPSDANGRSRISYVKINDT